MIFKDYYKILGLESNKVDTNDIKLAYREQAKKYHPDVNIGNKDTEDRFKDINEAYKILSDTANRKKYDKMWNSHIGRKKAKEQKQKPNMTRGEFIERILGIPTSKHNSQTKKEELPTQGENVETEITVSIIEAFFGLKKSIQLRTVKGNMKTFDVNIPAGIKDGEKLRLIGQGKPVKNGGKNGDLLIRIKIAEDKKYKLVGSDIYTSLSITPWEAVLGTKIDIDAIDESIGVYIPKGSTTGEEIKIKNKGYRDENGGRGDFVIKINIMISKYKTSEKERELYKQLAKISKFNPRKS